MLALLISYHNKYITSIFRWKDVDSLQSGTRGDGVWFIANNGNKSDIKSAVIFVPNYIEFSPRRSIYNHTKQVLYPG